MSIFYILVLLLCNSLTKSCSNFLSVNLKGSIFAVRLNLVFVLLPLYGEERGLISRTADEYDFADEGDFSGTNNNKISEYIGERSPDEKKHQNGTRKGSPEKDHYL